jgi:hypothetical protein
MNKLKFKIKVSNSQIVHAPQSGTFQTKATRLSLKIEKSGDGLPVIPQMSRYLNRLSFAVQVTGR